MKNQKNIINNSTPQEELEELQSIPELESINYEQEKSEEKNLKKKSKNPSGHYLPPLLRLTRRTIVFLTFTLIATCVFFITGNKQSFLDSNLNLILKIIACTAISLSFFTGTAIPGCIFYLMRDKKIKILIHLISYILIFAISIIIIFFSLTINLLSEGITF